MPIVIAAAQLTTPKMTQNWSHGVPDFSTSATPKAKTKKRAGV